MNFSQFESASKASNLLELISKSFSTHSVKQYTKATKKFLSIFSFDSHFVIYAHSYLV